MKGGKFDLPIIEFLVCVFIATAEYGNWQHTAKDPLFI